MSLATNTVPPPATGGKSEGKPPARPNPVAFEARVTVTGARPSSEGTRDLFTEETRTILVFVDGAVIQLAAGVTVGQLLFLTNKNTSEEVVCQILQKRVFRPTVCYVEVQFTEEKPNFWGVSFDKEMAGAVEFKVGEQVAAQETTGDGRGPAVAPRSEQEVEELKRQVETLRQQLQELETRKAQEAARQELAPLNDPVPVPSNAVASIAAEPAGREQTASGETLLMPAARGGKKAPRWAVPMALPGREMTDAERDSAEELLPQPELDFSQVPSAVPAGEIDPGSIYKPKGIPPHQMRQIALGVALAAVLGIGIYAKAWTLFPMLKTAAAHVVRQAKNAVSNRGGAKASAPVTGGSGTGTASATAAPAKSAPTNDAPAGQTNGTVPSNNTETAARAAVDTGAAAADSGPSAGVADPTSERRRPEPGEGKKTASRREKANLSNRASRSIAAAEPKPVQAMAADEPVMAPKLVHAAPPVYPPNAMLNYITGDVRAEFVVGADGKVGEVKVISGPKALRDAAIEALRKYEYAPGTQGGRPIAARTTATVKFWFNP